MKRTPDQKPRLQFLPRTGRWISLSAWDIGPDDDQTWRLNVVAADFSARLNKERQMTRAMFDASPIMKGDGK